jgi:LPS sulfotransferase NodH
LSSALGLLFESEAADRVIKFLRGRGERVCIVAPSWVRDRVTVGVPPDGAGPRATWSETAVSPVATAGGVWNCIVIAEDAALERTALATLSLGKDAKAYGLFTDVLPGVLCGIKNLGQKRPVRHLKRYAVLCLPRSGSRYVATTLARRGMGAPQEHIREPLAAVITEGKLGFKSAIAGLEHFGQRNEIFGTKLISTFLIKACRGSLGEIEANIGWMVDRGYQFVHLDRPLRDAVVSSYIASRLNQWHFFGEMNEQTRNVLNDLEFDGQSVWNEYIRFRAQKAITDHLVRRFVFPSFHYSTVEHSVDTIVASICGRLKVDPEELEPGAAPVPVATRTESPTYTVFAGALDQLLRERKEDITKSTIRTLRNLAGIDRETAEQLAGSIGSDDTVVN